MDITLVVINIVNRWTMVSKNKVPILYYWDESQDLESQIVNDDKFKTIYLSDLTLDDYNQLDLIYFKYKIIDGKEIYNENTIELNKLISFNDFNSKKIIDSIIRKRFDDFFNKSMGYMPRLPSQKIEEYVVNNYKFIKNQYQEKLYKMTFVNWVRSEISKELSSDNCNIIIQNLINILKDEN